MTLLIIPWLMIAPALAQTQTQTAAPESVAAPDKTPATATGKQTTDKPKDILQKIQDLQKQVDVLKDLGRAREKITIGTDEEKAEQEKAVLTAVGREYTMMQKGKIELQYGLRYAYISSSEILSTQRASCPVPTIR